MASEPHINLDFVGTGYLIYSEFFGEKGLSFLPYILSACGLEFLITSLPSSLCRLNGEMQGVSYPSLSSSFQSFVIEFLRYWTTALFEFSKLTRILEKSEKKREQD